MVEGSAPAVETNSAQSGPGQDVSGKGLFTQRQGLGGVAVYGDQDFIQDVLLSDEAIAGRVRTPKELAEARQRRIKEEEQHAAYERKRKLESPHERGIVSLVNYFTDSELTQEQLSGFLKLPLIEGENQEEYLIRAAEHVFQRTRHDLYDNKTVLPNGGNAEIDALMNPLVPLSGVVARRRLDRQYRDTADFIEEWAAEQEDIRRAYREAGVTVKVFTNRDNQVIASVDDLASGGAIGRAAEAARAKLETTIPGSMVNPVEKLLGGLVNLTEKGTPSQGESGSDRIGNRIRTTVSEVLSRLRLPDVVIPMLSAADMDISHVTEALMGVASQAPDAVYRANQALKNVLAISQAVETATGGRINVALHINEQLHKLAETANAHGISAPDVSIYSLLEDTEGMAKAYAIVNPEIGLDVLHREANRDMVAYGIRVNRNGVPVRTGLRGFFRAPYQWINEGGVPVKRKLAGVAFRSMQWAIPFVRKLQNDRGRLDESNPAVAEQVQARKQAERQQKQATEQAANDRAAAERAVAGIPRSNRPWSEYQRKLHAVERKIREEREKKTRENAPREISYSSLPWSEYQKAIRQAKRAPAVVAGPATDKNPSRPSIVRPESLDTMEMDDMLARAEDIFAQREAKEREAAAAKTAKENEAENEKTSKETEANEKAKAEQEKAQAEQKIREIQQAETQVARRRAILNTLLRRLLLGQDGGRVTREVLEYQQRQLRDAEDHLNSLQSPQLQPEQQVPAGEIAQTLEQIAANEAEKILNEAYALPDDAPDKEARIDSALGAYINATNNVLRKEAEGQAELDKIEASAREALASGDKPQELPMYRNVDEAQADIDTALARMRTHEAIVERGFGGDRKRSQQEIESARALMDRAMAYLKSQGVAPLHLSVEDAMRLGYYEGK